MLFSSSVFLIIFLPVLLIVYFNPFIKNRGYRNFVLMLFSLIFYAWGEPIFLFLLLFSCILNWKLTIQIEKSTQYSKIIMTILVAWNLSILFIYKYLTFILRECNRVFSNRLFGENDVIYTIALPLGISFFTFQIISYVIDVYRGAEKAQTSLLKLVLYIMMFPQLVAGPIVRYTTIANEIDHRKESLELVGLGANRFIIGLSKKLLLANYLAILADNAFYLSKTQSISVLGAWGGAIAYALQIYYDFSGYSDMAIGLGLIFGFHFEENFNYPYISKSISEFWRRWHISLGSWFRDYVFYSFIRSSFCKKIKQKYKHKNKKDTGTKITTVLGLLVVWTLTGIWHGAGWTYLFWGLYYGIFIIIEFLILPKESNKDKYGILKIFRTMLIVTVGYVLFRADTLGDAVNYFGNMLGCSGKFVTSEAMTYFGNSWILVLTAILLCCPIKLILKTKINAETVEKAQLWVTIPLFFACLVHCIGSGYSPFIYFNF